MFWSSEGYFFMRCTADDVRVMSQALAMHTVWQRMMARGMALVAVEEPGMGNLREQLDRLATIKAEETMKLSSEGLDALRAVLVETMAALREYARAPAGARSQGRGRHGMLEDCFGEELRESSVMRKVMGQLQALSQRIGLEAN